MKQVIVYTSIGCPECVQVIEYLKKAGIEFTECDIPDAEELKRIGALRLPMVVYGDAVIYGFNRTRLDKLVASQAVLV